MGNRQNEFSSSEKGRSFIYGGSGADKRFISTLDGCQIKIAGQLPFDFQRGACASTTDAIYLCFEFRSDYKSCRAANNPIEFGTEISTKSIYGHSRIRIAASDGQLNYTLKFSENSKIRPSFPVGDSGARRS